MTPADGQPGAGRPRLGGAGAASIGEGRPVGGAGGPGPATRAGGASAATYGQGVAGSDHVLFAEADGIGHILLNRPRALNSITPEMIEAIVAQLDAWAGRAGLRVIALRGAGERGLCAGGDVKGVREAVLRGSAGTGSAGAGSDAAGDFWSREYVMDLRLAQSPIPVVALMSGIVMGGGLGLSAHGAHRLLTPDARLAMPETAIGFFPDVGITRLLAGAPGELGTYVAMTGVTVTADDGLLLGLGDRIIDVADFDAAVAAVRDELGDQARPGVTLGADFEAAGVAVRDRMPPASGAPAPDAPAPGAEPSAGAGSPPDSGSAPGVDAAPGAGRAAVPGSSAAAGAATHAGAAPLTEQGRWIDECFAGDDAAAIVARLEGHPEAAARDCAALLRTRSPLAVCVTLERIRRAAAEPDLATTLEVDRRLAAAMMRLPDFPEGVRALLIDKDNAPRWAHARIEDVTAAEVDALFAGA